MKLQSFLAVSAMALTAPALAQTPPPPAKVTLTRLDCGQVTQPRDVGAFSDTAAYPYPKFSKTLTSSCYVIRHGDEVMLWDTGYPTDIAEQSKGVVVVKTPVVDQLKRLGIDPAKVKYIGISHYHNDHTGQAASLPGATLLIGQGDWDAVTANPPKFRADPKPLQHWISGGGKFEPVARDKDVFGDGSVTILDTPGHTPGHKSLLVRLPKKGPVLLTGDLTHFAENYVSNGVPSFNTDRADTLASLDRFKAMAKNLGATVIIQHEPADIGKLPAFPAAAD